FELQWQVSEDLQAGVAADCGMRKRPGRVDPRLDLSEVEPRDDGDVELHPAAHTFYDADELAPRMLSPAGAHREEVNESRLVRAGPESRHENEAIAQILASRPVAPDRRDR